ncbi:DUF1926 domain-containing protein [Geovibrio thiophilus]|uniref:DUF1926 domain-containing protein n=2 Tax=Geovibrio thiophilus TaxID=139438 RepID=A0A3R5XZH5_9BACT|nr:DUF1926 domain-containing protein [Geovibrio thiophilus]
MPFLFGIHCHQPVGNFSHVVDEAVRLCYAPFMEAALLYPKFRFAVHYSGWLLDYIRQNHKAVFTDMKKLSDNNQIEFFTGGYYEPVLSAIPSGDRRGQIEKLSGYINNHFGQMPDGLWLTERVWDPAIITDVAEVGVRNMIVDDYHFISAGYYKEMLNGYYVSEQDGKRVNLFPIDKNLRYLIPFKEEEAIVEYLENTADSGGKCSVIFDDGEKFGVWPHTYEWVYEEGWLERFLDTVISSGKCEFAFFGETADRVKPAGLAYLPITSYHEMGEWSLFAGRIEEMEKLQEHLREEGREEEAEVFVKGGIWKNFFAKYPESNRIHKRALRLSGYAAEMKDEALTEALYKAQCNDALWHGIFGGLYLPNLRNNSWSFIIEAEKEYERLAENLPMIETADLDYDGYDDAYVRTETFNASFTSRDCGQMTTLELKRNNVNLINTISRRKEAYHAMLLKDRAEDELKSGISTIHDLNVEITDEMKAMLVYDWYNKNSFIDHVTPEFDGEKFASCSFSELSDFTNQPAEMTAGEDTLTFSRSGGIYHNGKGYNAEIIKKFTFSGEGMEFETELTTDCPAELTYVCEMNFHLWNMAGVTVNGGESGSFHKGGTFDITDGITGTVTVETNAEGASSNVFYTVSQSEKGVDLTAQGVSLFIPVKFRGKAELTGRLKVQ